MQTVNEEKFFAWYDAVSRQGISNKPALLREAVRQVQETRREEFVLPASETKSGQEERYPFRYENLGCCGASTVFLTF